MNKLFATLTFFSTLLMLLGCILMVTLIGFNVTAPLDPPPVPVYFVPAGYAFIIWFFIYVGYIALGFYQWQSTNLNLPKFMKSRPYIILNALANITWFLGVISNQLWLTVICILTMLFTLVRLAIYLELGQAGKDWQEKLLVKLPLALYLGWITVATPINLTSFLIKDLNWTGQSVLNPEIWSVLVLGFALVIFYSLYLVRKVNAVFLLVGVWAFTAIYVGNNQLSPLVAGVALGMAIVLLLTLLLFQGRRDKGYAFL